jgi:hypothetical protein
LNVGSTAYVVADGTNVITTQTLQADTVAVTQPVGDNSTAIATTAFVKNQGYAAKAGDSFTGKVNMTASGLALSVTNNAQILGTLTLGNLAITTINASGAVSFTGSGIALNVTNDVTIGGLLHVLGTSGYSSFDTTLIANGDLLCTGSGYLKLPSGTTVQRPNPGDPASIRYNATTGRPEFGVGGNWTNFIKLSGDTMTGPLTTTAITATGTISGKTILGTDKGQANGYAPLDVNAKVPWVNLPVADRTFMLPFFFSGKPTSHQIYNFVIPSAMQLAENFAGTVVYDSTSTTNPAVFAVNKISGGVTTPIGTITVGPASNTALTLSTQLAVSFVTGDVLQMVAPLIVDETLSDVAFTMMATGVTTILPVDVPLQVFGVSAIGNFGQIKLIFSPIIPALGVVGVSKVTNVIIPRFASPAVVGKTGTGNVGTMATIFTHRQVLDGVAGISGVTTPAIYFSRGALLVGKAASGGVGNLASAASAGNTANVVGKAATADVGNLPIPAERATPVGAGRAGSLGNVIKFVQINPVGQTGVGGFGGTPMLNPLDCDPAITIGAGNFANNNTDGLHSIRGTRGITAGKYCFEVLIVNTGVSPKYSFGFHRSYRCWILS